jgi:hypothetical protein
LFLNSTRFAREKRSSDSFHFLFVSELCENAYCLQSATQQLKKTRTSEITVLPAVACKETIIVVYFTIFLVQRI